jgi:hypothetical protein
MKQNVTGLRFGRRKTKRTGRFQSKFIPSERKEYIYRQRSRDVGEKGRRFVCEMKLKRSVSSHKWGLPGTQTDIIDNTRTARK